MTQTFDEAYAGYRCSLAKLDATDDIVEKNLLFKQLTEQLSEMEERLNNRAISAKQEDPADENYDPTF